MALHLNLNHELERVRAQRRRDPFKLSMIALAIIAAGFAAQYFWALGKSTLLTREVEARRAEFATKDPLAKAAVAEEAELKRKLGNSDRFHKRIEGRFYWSPLIQEVVQTVPVNIQITRFAGDVTGDEAKKVQVNLDGLAAGEKPRGVAEDFLQKLRTALEKKYRNVTLSFRHLEDGTDTIPVDGKPQPTVNFAINIQFQHGEAPTAAPVRKP
jgi:hypothetical protein